MIFAFNLLLLFIPYIIYCYYYKPVIKRLLGIKKLKELLIKDHRKSYGTFFFGLFLVVTVQFLLPLSFYRLFVIANIIIGKGTYLDLEILAGKIFISTIISIIYPYIFRYHRRPIDNKEKIILLSVILFVSSLLVYDYSFSVKGNKNVYINEVCRREVNETRDDFGNEVIDDISYVSLFNNGKYPIYYEILYFSTDEDNMMEHQVRNITINPKESYQIKMSYGDLDLSKTSSTNIFISCDRYMNEILASIEIPILETDTSYIYDSSNDIWSIKDLEPLKFKKEVLVEAPEFSKEGGFYDSDFELFINVPLDTTVYYTTDCNDPTEESNLYTGEPIEIYNRSIEENIYRNISNVLLHQEKFKTPSKVDKCNVIRAIAIDANGNKSDIVTASYFVNLNKYKDNTVISLVTDPKGLFDEESGIYVSGKEYDDWYLEQNDSVKLMDRGGKINGVKWFYPPKRNYTKSGIENELLSNLELFENDINLNQEVGIRIQGNSSRELQLKRFSIYSRKEYSVSNTFDIPLIDNLDLHKVYTKTAEKELIVPEIVNGRNLTSATGKPVTVFLDGEFWYNTYLFTKFDDEYISSLYDLHKNNISVSVNGSGVDKAGETHRYIINNAAHYSIDTLSEIADIQSYVDYMVTLSYLGNSDTTDTSNGAVWTTNKYEDNPYADVRIRWSLNDLDGCMRTRYLVNTTPDPDGTFRYTDNYFEWLEAGEYYEGHKIYKALVKDPKFKEMFVKTAMDMINTCFSNEHVLSVLSKYGYDLSYANNFFINRKEFYLECMEEEMGIEGSKEKVILETNNPNAGTVKLNTLTLDLSKPFVGEYYTDYQIEVTAIPDEGNTFSHFEVNGSYYSDSSSIKIDVLEGGMTINAIYK